MEIRRLGPGDVERVVSASSLFDDPTTRERASRFLAREGHHLMLASIDDVDVGFVTGVETTHPDKGTEMFLYELGVAEEFRRRGIGRRLVTALAGLARELGCYGMWVASELDNGAALATYRAAGAAPPEPSVTLSWTFGTVERRTPARAGESIFHIATRRDWEAARADGEYRVSTLGRGLGDEGFIHCGASRTQVLAVADSVYAEVSEPLVLLAIDVETVGSEVRYEAPDDRPDPFPHVYGPIPVSSVCGVADLERDADGTFRWPDGYRAE